MHFHILQHLKRTGWVLRGVKEPESVASHTYRMAMMAFMFGGNGVDPSVNRERCTQSLKSIVLFRYFQLYIGASRWR